MSPTFWRFDKEQDTKCLIMTDSVHTVVMTAIKETSSIARYSNIILANYYSTFEEHIIYNTIIYYRYEYTMVN
jgi:hypothetical protein